MATLPGAKIPVGSWRPMRIPALLISQFMRPDKLVTMDNITASCVRKLSNGETRESVIAGLVELGMNQPSATEVVTRTAHQLLMYTTDEIRARKVEESKGTALWGAGMCGLGVIITFGSYAIASPGGVYILTTGLIIGGGVMFLKGLAGMR